MMRAAVFLPSPGTEEMASESSVTSALRNASGVNVEQTASATFGPTPVTPSNASNIVRSDSVAKP